MTDLLPRVSPPLVRRRSLILAVHIALIPLAYLTAFALRFDFRIPGSEFAHFRATVWYLVAIRLLVFHAFGLYRGYWKHVGLRDLLDLSAAVTLSSILIATALALLGLTRGMPRSVLPLDWVVMIFFSGGIRFAFSFTTPERGWMWSASRTTSPRRTVAPCTACPSWAAPTGCTIW